MAFLVLFPTAMKTLRIVLIFVLVLIAFNAVGGAMYGLAGAEGVPVAWLRGSPFPDYKLPSVLLLIAVGGPMTTAAITLLTRHPFGPGLAFVAGAILIAWLGAQVWIIGLVSWLQLVSLVVAVLVLALAVALIRKGQS